MQTPTQDQANFLLQLALPSMEREQQITAGILQAVPADKKDYRPDPNAMSAFELAWHIVGAENMFYSGIAAGEFDFTLNRRPEEVQSMRDLLVWYEERFARNHAQLRQLSPEAMVKPLDFRGVFTLPAVQYVHFALSHSIHHRGQLSVYLRPMGAKVPSIYGESYDSAMARKAAAQQS